MLCKTWLNAENIKPIKNVQLFTKPVNRFLPISISFLLYVDIALHRRFYVIL